MRVLIAEEALQSGAGHWPSYIGGLGSAFREAGDRVEVAVHRGAGEDLCARVGGTPWFSRNCWIDTRSQGALGGLRHNFIYHRELKDWLRREEEPLDWVLALTVRPQHLLALARLGRDREAMGGARLLLLFVQGFGRYNGPGRSVCFSSTPTNRMARFCFRLLAPAVREGRAVLAAETNGMRRELEEFSDLPVKLFPHPVPPPEKLPPPVAGRSPFLLTAPGFARHEKGSDLLRTAIEELLGAGEADGVEFVLQWPEPFSLHDGSPLGPGERLASDPRVRLVNENLDPAAYEKLIAESGAVLLPYRRNSYHNRLSRVAIEAAGRGKPLLYTTGTWTEEVAVTAGTGVPVHEESARALAAAIREAVARRHELEARAREGAAAVASFHTAATFRQQLQEIMEK
ncbi:MAG: hypothetical protein GVY10_01570 [Verrucomicrobia bacterium]|jgi:glycosyltransferase involved in cell wall biosynthesis|nr:hypothetical protein [Verrucomicrobiota bacterium]